MATKQRADAALTRLVLVPPGMFLGLAGAWIGLTVQHCGNHGAMSTKPWLNNFYGMCNDVVGASSLMWRYHHQVRPRSSEGSLLSEKTK